MDAGGLLLFHIMRHPMAELQNWPAWRYGPSGEAQIFQREADVPKGWKDSPGKLPPAPEKLGGERRSQQDDLRAQREKKLADENERLRAENEHLQAELAKALSAIPKGGETAPPAEKPASARRPRKLSAAPVTAQDDTITMDEGRTERIRVLREAGFTIEDDATDGDIEEALDFMEKQGKSS